MKRPISLFSKQSEPGVYGQLAIKRSFLPILVLLWILSSANAFATDPVKEALTRRGPNDIGVRTIVIDAGHGGKDPGCHGSSANEKDVCLNIALALGKSIEENYDDVKVIYTRKTDVFVELHERAAIANRNDADLFICIHANSGPGHAHGAETYVMGLHKNEANLKVAKRENSAILMEDGHEENYQDFDGSPESIIAISIQQAAYLQHSVDFASKVQKQFKKLGRTDRGVKQAGFLVLYRTTMPSVLIETGFLTNKEEEKWLDNPSNQKIMAGGIFKAFESYKKEIDAVNGAVNGDIGSIRDVREEPVNATVEDENENPKETPEEEKPEETPAHGITYRVQIATSSSALPKNAPEFRGATGVDEYISGGLYKYTIGRTPTFAKAKDLQKELRDKGFSGSFIVAFKDGLRIDLQDAIRETDR